MQIVKDFIVSRGWDYLSEIEQESEYWSEDDERIANRQYFKELKEFCEEQME